MSENRLPAGTGKFVLFQAGEIVEGLSFRADKVPPSALLFDQKHTLPEQVNEAARVPQPFNWLFEGCDTPARDAKNFKELVVKSLAFASFIARVFPFFGEAGSTSPDLIPAKAHTNVAEVLL
jgi:hypothetical protein